jgi:hypothetical protein
MAKKKPTWRITVLRKKSERWWYLPQPKTLLTKAVGRSKPSSSGDITAEQSYDPLRD